MAYLILQWGIILMTSTPVCAAPIMKCPFPNELKDGEMEYRGRLVGSIIYFQCDDGYWLKGSPKWTCLPNGTWSTNDTRCEAPRKCPFPKELKNGQLYFRGQQPSHQMFDITCDRGYYLHGPSLRTCQPDGKWSGDDPICKVVRCKLLMNTKDAVVYVKGQNYGDIAIIECRPGYIYTGKRKRICQANNEWSGKEGQCIHRLTEICPKPISPEHGNVNITGRKFNDSLTVVCDEGYHYTGTLVRRCHGNGHWSGGVGYCKALNVKCPSPDELEHGWMARRGRKPGDIVSFTCDQGYWLRGPAERTCQPNGTWSSTSPVCKPVKCPIPPDRDNTIVAIESKESNYVLVVRCLPGYVDYSGTRTMTCQPNKTWTGKPAVCQAKEKQRQPEQYITITLGAVGGVLVIIGVSAVIYAVYYKKCQGNQPGNSTTDKEEPSETIKEPE